MISAIIPFYNEEKSLPILLNNLNNAIKKIGEKFEIILVDDGSTDEWKKEIRIKGSEFKIIRHRKRLGKGKALLSGFNASSGETLIFMDADLQDDPADLNKFLKKINAGFDLVNGWRVNRKDPLSKTIPSRIFNFLILKIFFHSKFHDINCGYKAVKRDVLETIPLYGDNYRFLPLAAEHHGFTTTEVVVTHHFRKFGKSKFGFFRLFFGLFDTITVYFIYEFSEKPLHFFGPAGVILFSVGFLITLILVIQRIFYRMMLYRRPLFLIGILLIIVGLQIVMTGIIGELIVFLSKKNSNKK